MSLKRIGKKAFSILKGLAPTIATAVGGPFGGIAAGILAEALGVKPNEVEDFILAASPEDLLKLKLAEENTKKWMREADIKEDQLEYQDRADARQLARERGVQMQAALSAVFIFGYFVIVFFLVKYGLPTHLGEFTKGVIVTLMGVLTAAIPQILSFWFGSSRGSKEKTDVMASALGGKIEIGDGK